MLGNGVLCIKMYKFVRVTLYFYLVQGWFYPSAEDEIG